MQSKILKQFILLSGVLSLAACAHQQAPTLTRGAALTIVTDDASGHLDTAVDDKVEKAGKGVALGIAGGIGGAAAGGIAGAVFGLGCGPLAIICVPMAMAAGAGTGGAVGGAAGAQYGGVGGVPVEKARSFNRLSSQTLQREQILADLEGTFHRRASHNWQIAEHSANQVVLRLLKLDFEQPGYERLRIRLKAEAEATIDGRKRIIRIERANAPVHVDQWLDDGEFLAAELESVIDTTARALVTALAVGA
jgi:hypothetical protein